VVGGWWWVVRGWWLVVGGQDIDDLMIVDRSIRC
jgi:hypothetical protein